MEIKNTIEFVTLMHKDQKYGQTPFIVHPMLVARHFDDPLYQTVALLHDIVEDTTITLVDILMMYDKTVMNAIDALTRRNNEDYFDYIERLSHNEIAIRVKLADLGENIYSAKYNYPGEYDNLLARYYKATKILMKKIK